MSLILGQTARAAGIAVSWAPRAALDNAGCESFFTTLKRTSPAVLLAHPPRASDRRFRGIEGWYNRRRVHSTLGYLAPRDYENRTLMTGGTGLAASRLAPTSQMIKEKPA